MTTAEERFSGFVDIVGQVRSEHPNWFRLSGDPRATDEQLLAVEKSLRCELPPAYRMFLSAFGGHHFAFVSIYSASPGSPASMVARNDVPWLAGVGFVAFADNGCGDFYGWRVLDGKIEDEVVLLDHASGEIVKSDFADFLDFVEREGLQR